MATALIPSTQLDPPGYVLVVMDDAFLRQIVRVQAEDMGLPVQEGLSVRRALARVATRRPELVLLDLWVDHGDGLRFLEGLRDVDPTRRVRVLLVGDDPRADVQLRALELGAGGPIPLPEMAELGHWLEQAFEAT